MGLNWIGSQHRSDYYLADVAPPLQEGKKEGYSCRLFHTVVLLNTKLYNLVDLYPVNWIHAVDADSSHKHPGISSNVTDSSCSMPQHSIDTLQLALLSDSQTSLGAKLHALKRKAQFFHLMAYITSNTIKHLKTDRNYCSIYSSSCQSLLKTFSMW